MKLEMHGQMRLEQKMKLAPHMIQSMEILQMSILALQERIEQELNSNPVLELADTIGSAENAEVETTPAEETDTDSAESEAIEDFGRIESLDDGYMEYMDQTQWASSGRRTSGNEPDRKLEALSNTAAPQRSLHEHLTEQWRLVDAPEPVKNAGEAIIDYINERGYLSTRLEQLYNKDKNNFNFEDMQEALKLIHQLEPAGVGARDLKECLLIQLSQKAEDTTFERRLVEKCMDELLENRLPEIAKKMRCSIEDINRAIERLSKLDTSPGLQIGQDRNHIITTDVIVEPTEDGGYEVHLADGNIPNLSVSKYYSRMSHNDKTSDKTKKFLQENIRNARWIIEAIEQRKNTLLKVAKSIVKHQKDFFDKGQIYLKPLPMSRVADEVGVHLATVSRAVAGKYVQCSRGILPLRKFFSGGTEDINGNGHSWEAIRGLLQKIIDAEDKTKPLSDDKIRQELEEAGIKNLARRTVAKYRKLLNIPSARLRKRYKAG